MAADSSVTEVSDQSFQKEVLESSVPVLVDFWAPWCAPCRAIAPIIEDVSKELGGKVKILKMNVDDNAEVPSKLSIRSIPTLKVFVGGKEVNQMVGAASKDALLQLLKPYTASVN